MTPQDAKHNEVVICHKKTGLELYFEKHPRCFSFVNSGKKFTLNNAFDLLNFLEQERVDISNLVITRQ